MTPASPNSEAFKEMAAALLTIFSDDFALAIHEPVI
jgi:hypothetical protein